jgi:hypothetical protein
MDMKKVSSGKLRAIGYDTATRTLQVEMDSGSVMQYTGVPAESFRRLSSAGSMWSYFRDSIEEEFPARRVK